MGTKSNPGAFDCYANAQDDEPMFVLLARDHRAPALVRAWVDRHRTERMEAEGDFPYNLDNKEREALAIADAMEAWRLDVQEAGQ